MRWLSVLSCFLALATTPAWAQPGTPAEVQHRNDCRLAQQVLVHGQPANKRQWALGYFVRCSDTAAETAVRLLRRYAPTAAPDADFERFVASASTLVDRNLALAAIDLAENAGAPAYARVQAMRILHGQARPDEPLSFHYAVRPPGRVVARDSMGVTYQLYEQEHFPQPGPVFTGTPSTSHELLAIAARLALVASADAADRDVQQAAENVALAIESQIRFLETCPAETPVRVCFERMRARHGNP